MITLLTVIHVIVCFFLIIVVLLQSGKAADLAGAFGGMGSQTAFGPRGAATVLSKATTTAAVLFMLTSISLGVMGGGAGLGGATGGDSVVERTGVGGDANAPAAPAQGAAGSGGVNPVLPIDVPEGVGVEVEPIGAPAEGGEAAPAAPEGEGQN